MPTRTSPSATPRTDRPTPREPPASREPTAPRDLPSRRERLHERPQFERTHTERPASARPSARAAERLAERGAEVRRRVARDADADADEDEARAGSAARSGSRGRPAGERGNVLDFEAAHRSRRAASARSSAQDEELERLSAFASAQAAEAAPVRQRAGAACPPCHWGLFVLSLLLTALSIPLIYSASTAIALDHHGRPDYFLGRQIGFAAVGAILLLATSRLSSRGLRTAVWICYAVALLGLLATDFTPLGLVNGGVRRWAKLGPLQFQFSELAKIALVGVMADYWSRAGRYAPRQVGPWIVTALLALPLVGLVFLQPHLSAASLLFLLPFFVAFYAGAAWQSIAKIALPLITLAAVTVVLCSSHKMPLLKEYQQERIAAHFSGTSDQQGSNYQALQGQGALMRGGLLGSGPGGSLYKQGHLPAPHTDFILAVTGEEWGLVGMTLLLGMYGLMIFFCFHAGHCANSPFEALMCAGIGTLLGVQVVCNVGVVTGILPVTGMPLPLLSFGGSGMICMLLGLGFVLSVSRRFNCDKNDKNDKSSKSPPA